MTLQVMLAKTYDPEKHDITGWYAQEKLDGIRAIWTGERLVSRNNKPFYYPEEFVKKLPKGLQLDGELTLGRGRFQETVSVVRKQYYITSEWEEVQYKVYDVINDQPYPIRIKLARDVGLKTPLTIKLLSKPQLEGYYETLLDGGAEGVILRHPTAGYDSRRSPYLLKYKPLFHDEALVVDYQLGTGKYTNMVGALICDWKDQLIVIGSGLTDAQRDEPPAVGSTISFCYRGLTDSGQPRHASFIGERNYE